MNILEHPDHSAYVDQLLKQGHKVQVYVEGNQVWYTVNDVDGTTWKNVWEYNPADYPEDEE